jgi:hypothetical protein
MTTKKTTLRNAARAYAAEAFERLAVLMRTGSSEQVQLAAARELLDRSHGKPASAATGAAGDAEAASLRALVLRAAARKEATENEATGKEEDGAGDGEQDDTGG